MDSLDWFSFTSRFYQLNLEAKTVNTSQTTFGYEAPSSVYDTVHGSVNQDMTELKLYSIIIISGTKTYCRKSEFIIINKNSSVFQHAAKFDISRLAEIRV